MKTKLHFLFAMFIGMSFLQAQEITVNTSMGSSYSNQVFYKLDTEAEVSFAANSWDIAMLRTSAYDFALRVNGGVGINVFEASNNLADWATIDVSQEASWTQLYNSDTQWNEGAFDRGSATYGWGEYNTTTHHVEGTVVFVLKYSDGTYRKFINEDFYGGYTFKYSTWNGSNWSTDQTVTIPNSNNPSNTYNYYSLENNTEVVAAPAQSEEDNLITIKSPIIGTFYRKATPDNPSFVEIGQVIKEGDVLCIIEAMKLFNEIESELSGTIVKILVDDASPVEFDQPLFVINPS